MATELSKAYAPVKDRAICSQLKLGYQESRKQTVSRYKPVENQAPVPLQCIAFKEFATEADRTKAVAAHVQAGLALSDYFCDNFFERVAEHAGKRRFARNSTNDVGSMVSVVLGLAAAGSGWTGGVGAGFGLADSFWRNYDENFLVSADLPTMQQLVYSEQDKFRDGLKTRMPANFSDATNVIIRYANLCSFVGMRRLLTTTMGEKASANIEKTKSPDDLVSTRAKQFLDAYAAAQAGDAQKPPADVAPSADAPSLPPPP
ncbi:hypothetical protein [Sphingobium ummariense]